MRRRDVIDDNLAAEVIEEMGDSLGDPPEVQEVLDEIGHSSIPLSVISKAAELQFQYTVDKVLLGNRWLQKAAGLQPKFPYMVDSFERSVAMEGRKSDSIQKGKEKIDEPESQGVKGFANLPSAITASIMLQLPMKSIAINKCVHKNWNTRISDPVFVKQYFERAPVGLMIRTDDDGLVSRTVHHLHLESECNNNNMKIEPEFKLPFRNVNLVLDRIDENNVLLDCKPKHHKFAVTNSCNGLLCLYNQNNKEPFVVCNPITGEFILLPEATIEDETFGLMAGLGFHSKTNEYKVVRMWKKMVKGLRGAR